MTPQAEAQGPAQAAEAAKPPRKRSWDAAFLGSLSNTAQRAPIRFELVDGEWASGTIQYAERKAGETVYVSGQLTTPEAGRFFVQKQTRPGVAGDFVGVVEFPGSEKAYRIEPSGLGGAPELVERPLKNVLCLKLPPATNVTEEIPPLRPDAFPDVPIPAYQTGIVVLESLAGSTPVLYLDFQGGYTPTWGGITYDRPNVDNAAIRDVWKRVAEDYMPFNINVTTDLKVVQNAPPGSRQRVVISPTSTAAPGAGGVAYVGSFNWTGTPDTPCWVFMVSGKACAEAASHEAGHTLGLSHDGQDVGTNHTEYYGGQGSGATGWAPIMGVGYYQPVSQWSKGEYTNANQHQDDIAIISTNNNNVAYRADDTGDTLATSRYFEVYSNNSAFAEGVIERTADTDAFQFTTSGGTVTLRADPVGDWGNLAIQATLCNATETVLASNNPQTTLWASISTNLAAGTYTFKVTGTGRNNPLTDGFSAYASLGYYTVTGMVAGARLPNRFSIAERSTNGTQVGVVPATNPNGNPLVYMIISGNISNTFAIDSSGRLTVANNGALNYETLARNTQFPVQFELFVNITNTVNSTQTELNRRVVVAITNINEAPSLTGFATTVLEHTQPGTVLGSVAGSDPDFYTLLVYAMAGGNSNNMFAIDTNSGAISVAGDLSLATQASYSLSVVVSDQTQPLPLMATSTVAITVLSNASAFQPGTISYAVYDNISGTAISALTNAPSYPRDPTWEKQVSLFEGDINRADNYGAVMRGYLIPPATGSYTFWIATDDNGELWLSTSTNPAAATRIAYVANWTGSRVWTTEANQQSTAVSLVAGHAYYIEARMKEGGGNDNIAVAWQCTTAGITRDVIPGKFLAPYFLNYVPHASGFTANLHQDALTGSRVGPVTVTDVNTNDGHSFAITGGNSSGIFSVDTLTGVIRVANDSALLAASQTNYTLQVTVTDNGSPPLSALTNVTITLVPTNAITVASLRQELWNNIGSGTAVSDLTNNARYPKQPDTLRALTMFDSGQGLGDNYGSRIRGYLTPTTSGSYTFFISSDDSSQLNLSTSTNPAAASMIAYVNGYSDYQTWTKYSSQQSAPISLTAGQRYYIETLQKEGGGNDHVSVAWTGPGLSGTTIIDGSFLTPVDLNYPPAFLDKTAQVLDNAANGTIIATVVATDNSLDTLTYKIVSGNPSNTFAIDPDTGLVTLANTMLLGSYAGSAFRVGIQAQDSGYGGLYPLKSAQATLTVQVVGTRPTVTLVSPANGAIVAAPLTMSATASAPFGALDHVGFYADGALMGVGTNTPYSFTWSNASLGAHTLLAIAGGTNGLSVTSAPVSIMVGGLNWTAYNDHSPGTTIGWGTRSSVTTYNLRNASLPALTGTGPLTNAITGAVAAGSKLAVGLQVATSGSPGDGGVMGYPLPGTPAYSLFNGYVDLGNADSGITLEIGNTATITFTNLDPRRRYSFRGTSTRDGGYPGRWTLCSIVGAASWVNAHTPGCVTSGDSRIAPNALTNGQAIYNSGINTNGEVVGWDTIVPGTNNSFSVVSDNYRGAIPSGSVDASHPYAICGFSLQEFELTPPVITLQPQSQIASNGHPVVFKSVALGAVRFQWLQNGTNRAGGINSNLTLAASAAVDGAVYQIVVSNLCGSVTSSPAKLVMDSDGDGIPDQWMQQYFGHATNQVNDLSWAGDDADGDGMTNLQEYLAGANPTNQSSALAQKVDLNNQQILITFATSAGHTYEVQSTTNVTGAPWQTLTNVAANPVPPGLVTVSDSILAPDSKFYRITTPQAPQTSVGPDGSVFLTFTALAGSAYQAQYQTVPNGPWQNLPNGYVAALAGPAARVVIVTDVQPPPGRSYRFISL